MDMLASGKQILIANHGLCACWRLFNLMADTIVLRNRHWT